MSTRPNPLYSNQGSWALFYLYYVMFVINETLFKNKNIQTSLWDLIKCELFYVGGGCQHSGNCCRSLMIFHKGTPINHTEKYEALKKNDEIYKRFVPNLITEKTIKNFSCNCLTKDNRCSKYATRPQFCVNYSLSNFLQHDQILKGCGYKILRTQVQPQIRNKALAARIHRLVSLNNLQYN